MIQKRTLIFISIIFVFLLPMIAGDLLYYFHDHFKLKQKNHGILLNPPLHATLGHHKQWQMILVYTDQCDKQCEKIFFNLQQVKKLLGEKSERVNVARFNFKQGEKVLGGNIDSNQIYLVDPLNNVFMSYLSSANPLDILKDLKTVLEVSSIG